MFDICVSRNWYKASMTLLKIQQCLCQATTIPVYQYPYLFENREKLKGITSICGVGKILEQVGLSKEQVQVLEESKEWVRKVKLDKAEYVVEGEARVSSGDLVSLVVEFTTTGANTANGVSSVSTSGSNTSEASIYYFI